MCLLELKNFVYAFFCLCDEGLVGNLSRFYRQVLVCREMFFVEMSFFCLFVVLNYFSVVEIYWLMYGDFLLSILFLA